MNVLAFLHLYYSLLPFSSLTSVLSRLLAERAYQLILHYFQSHTASTPSLPLCQIQIPVRLSSCISSLLLEAKGHPLFYVPSLLRLQRLVRMSLIPSCQKACISTLRCPSSQLYSSIQTLLLWRHTRLSPCTCASRLQFSLVRRRL